MLESPWTQTFLSRLKEAGVPWRSGTDEPEKLLSGAGWAARVTLPGESEAHFGRWPYRRPSRQVPRFPRSYLLRATRRLKVEPELDLRGGP